MAELDIIIPVYNEKDNIVSVLDSLHNDVKTPYRVLICYDFDEDTTLEAIAKYPRDRVDIVLVKSNVRGPHAAIMAGINESNAPIVMTHMGDDAYTTHHIDYMVEKSREGFDIVTGSRFIEGGKMVGCRWHKKVLTWLASFTLYHFADFPVHDATHGVRVFSRRVIDTVKVESTVGFTFSFEMLVKAHRLGWPVHEFPVEWCEREKGSSRFQLWKWATHYLRWYFFAVATTWLWRGPDTVPRKDSAALAIK